MKKHDQANSLKNQDNNAQSLQSIIIVTQTLKALPLKTKCTNNYEFGLLSVYKIKATKGPVQSGEELLSILPEGEEMLLEVKVLNRDIGFINQGMKAKVKIATFPFQEFGVVEGEVLQISPNAIIDKELGLVFPTRIKLSKHSLIISEF